jgi:hypothetical protein
MESKNLLKYLDKQGVTVRVHSKNLLPEEAPYAYKDAWTPVKITFSLSQEEESCLGDAVAVTVHAFNIF